MKFFFVFTLIAAVPVLNVSAQLKLPAFFSDSMVLQQDTNAPVWGWAKAGEKVEVSGSWSGKNVQAIADNTGKWMVKLPTPKAGGPYDVTIKANETTILHGVLIGEVWICSGQSNMEMPVQGWAGAPIHNAATEIAGANYPSIRFFTVEKNIAFTPQQDVKGAWSSCSPASAATFSATAYFFGRALYNHLHVPIGLIHTSWGGTIAEAWTSEASLRTMGDFNKGLDAVGQMATNLKEILFKDSVNAIAWKKALAENNNAYAGDATDTSWHTMQLPALWESKGLDIDGIVWFKRAIDIPAAWQGKTLNVDLGPVDDNDVTFLNGSVVDSTMQDGSWAKDRNYSIPANLVKTGRNVLAVKVIDNAGNGGIYGRPEQLRLYAEGGHDTINLSGDWLYKVAAVKPPVATGSNPNQPSVLYNGMIAPLVPFAIKGAVWYQGESNVGRAKQYSKLFPLMISDWRRLFNAPDFPFYFVQIAPYKYGGDSTQAAALRDAQRRTLSTLPNTGMAVTMDIGQTDNIHPEDKQDVGKRLSLWALNKTYGDKSIVYSGPLYKGFEVKGNKVIVSFTNADGGLTSNNKPLKDFELQDTDGSWKPATAAIEGDKVIVSSDAVAKPTGVRYAYYSYAQGTLFNGKGLPASSFTSEDLK
ncbi:sialate O-acetylesterase [Parafilimonas sp.]|uniref:sialate O-acetylesterase n=1 Tax=Parafilimonas sp. TaxID=1969739 RepID=UPI0039E2BB67